MRHAAERPAPAVSEPRAAEGTRAQAGTPPLTPPPGARALLRTDSGGATAPQAGPGRRPTLDRRGDGGSPRPASLTHPATCDVHTEPRRPQGRRGRASARAAAARSTSARGAGGGREAKAPGRGGARRRAHRRDQWACSKWPAWAGHNADGRGRGLRGGAGRDRCSSRRPIRMRPVRPGRGLVLEGGAGVVPYGCPGAEVWTSLVVVYGSVNPRASTPRRIPAWRTQAYYARSLCTPAGEHCSPSAQS